MTVNPVIGARMPPAVLKMIEKDIDDGLYRNASDWVRMACMEYLKIRQRERGGGGKLIIGSRRAQFTNIKILYFRN